MAKRCNSNHTEHHAFAASSSTVLAKAIIQCFSLSKFPILIMLAACVHAEPKPWHAEFDLYRGASQIGSAQMQLQQVDATQWRYATSTEASLFFLSYKDNESSVFIWQNNLAQPQHYERLREMPTRDEKYWQNFNWQTQLESGGKNKKTWSIALTAGTQDKQSHMLQLQQDLMAGKKDFIYQVSDGGKVREYHYAVTGEEVLSTALGELSTVRVERLRSTKERETISWFAPKLGYIPVKVKQIEDGDDSAEMRIRVLNN